MFACAVYVSSQPTNIAYLLLKLKIEEDGTLSPMLKMGLTPSSLDKVNIDILNRTTSVTATEPQGAEEAPTILPKTIMKLSSTTAKSSDTTATPRGAPVPVVEEVQVVQTDVLEAAAPMGVDAVDYGGEHNHYQCGSRDFQVFLSGSYQGDEMRMFL